VDVADLRESWRSGWLQAAAYDAVVKRQLLARVLAPVIWGTDIAVFYAEVGRLSNEPEGCRILDIPCGGGVAFRGLRPGQRVHYVAADLSRVMLARARSEAVHRGLEQIEFVETDVEALPFSPGSFDLCISYAGLHCFPDPPAAIRKLGRVLAGGGELRGTSLVAGEGACHDALIRLGQLRGIFGPVATTGELESWLSEGEMEQVRVRVSGALARFSARRARDGQ
jgi:SAM-dependent methyltransferase